MRLKSLLLLVVPTLFALPGYTQDLDVQTGTVRVRMDQAGGIRIDSLDGGTVMVPSYGMPISSGHSRIWQPSTPPVHSSVINSVPTVVPRVAAPLPQRSPALARLRCTSDVQQNNQTSHRGGSISQTQSSMTTSVCH